MAYPLEDNLARVRIYMHVELFNCGAGATLYEIAIGHGLSCSVGFHYTMLKIIGNASREYCHVFNP